MAVITKVSVQKKPGRYNIFLDGDYAFSASEKTLAEFVLLKGKELTDQQIYEIKQFDADAKATDLAAHYLSYEPRTVYEVLVYLQKHDVSNQAAENAVQELNSLGYLDDQQYVSLFLKNNFRIGNDGPKNIAKKLRQKGVDSTIVEQKLDEESDSWLIVAERLVKSMKNKVGKISRRELEQKITAKLLMHGFNYEIAQSVLDELDLDPDKQKENEALKCQGIKAYKKFRRYSENERKFKMKRYLFTHGFSSSEVDAFLNGEIISFDELAEY